MPSSLVIKMRIGAASSFCDPYNAVHIDAQYLRHRDGTIAVLVIFEHRDERAPDGNARTIQRVNEPRVLRALRPVTRIHSPRLEIAANRAGRNFTIAILARQPDLDVIGFL